MEVADFAEIEAEFSDRVQRMVWCNLATVDAANRPRSRIVHPLWEGPVCWLATRRHSFKARHLDHNPYVSLAYVADVAKPIYADCRAAWVEDLAEKQRVWDLIKATPPPLGYDPAPIYERPDHPNFGLLKLQPWRLELYNFPAAGLVWRP
jgi:general stress protein 26